jgi:rubrerythrin
LKQFFKTAPRTELKKGAIQLSGYQMAMKMEKATYNAYKEFQESASTEPEKKFFAALMKEENEHYAALANVYQYLTSNGDWLQEDEGQTWNWMNS